MKLVYRSRLICVWFNHKEITIASQLGSVWLWWGYRWIYTGFWLRLFVKNAPAFRPTLHWLDHGFVFYWK